MYKTVDFARPAALRAIRAFRDANGRQWKQKLAAAWADGSAMPDALYAARISVSPTDLDKLTKAALTDAAIADSHAARLPKKQINRLLADNPWIVAYTVDFPGCDWGKLTSNRMMSVPVTAEHVVAALHRPDSYLLDHGQGHYSVRQPSEGFAVMSGRCNDIKWDVGRIDLYLDKSSDEPRTGLRTFLALKAQAQKLDLPKYHMDDLEMFDRVALLYHEPRKFFVWGCRQHGTNLYIPGTFIHDRYSVKEQVEGLLNRPGVVWHIVTVKAGAISVRQVSTEAAIERTIAETKRYIRQREQEKNPVGQPEVL